MPSKYDSFKHNKRDAITAAIELDYDHSVVEKLRMCTTESQLTRVLHDARHGLETSIESLEASIDLKDQIPTKSDNRRKVKIVETGEVFNSLADCARRINGFSQEIGKVINNPKRTHRGFYYIDVGGRC